MRVERSFVRSFARSLARSLVPRRAHNANACCTRPHGEDASEVLRHNSVIIRRARPRTDRPGENDIQMRRKSIPRWNRRGLRLEKRGARRRARGRTDAGWPGGGDRGAGGVGADGTGAQRSGGGKWIKFQRMFLFGRDSRGIDMASPLRRLSFAARLSISAALASLPTRGEGGGSAGRDRVAKWHVK